MINAQQAKEKSEQMRIANFQREIEKVIKYNIDKGRNEARVSGKIPEEIKAELLQNGYSIEEQNGITKILW